VILDLGLPDMQGQTAAEPARKRNSVPSSSCRARTTSRKVRAFDSGADDYVTKPFGMNELLPRRAALRHRLQAQGEAGLSIGGLSVRSRAANRQGGCAEVKLSPKEYELCVCSSQHAGKCSPMPSS